MFVLLFRASFPALFKLFSIASSILRTPGAVFPCNTAATPRSFKSFMFKGPGTAFPLNTRGSPFVFVLFFATFCAFFHCFPKEVDAVSEKLNPLPNMSASLANLLVK